MATSVLTCPQCGSALAPPSRFARTTTCPACQAVVTIDLSIVSASRFKDALAAWNAPARDASAVTLPDGTWRLVRPLGRGTRTEVWLAERTRWPTERGVLKLPLAPEGDAAAASEAAALRALRASGERVVGTLLPAFVTEGVVVGGPRAGRHVVVARAAPRFVCDLVEIGRRFPGGIDPAASIWMLRRMLELTRILLETGVVHAHAGPEHWLVEEADHGLRLVGFGHARVDRDEASVGAAGVLRTVGPMLLGLLRGPEGRGQVPASVGELLTALGAVPDSLDVDAILALRTRAGEVGEALPGGPRFVPLLP